MEMKIGTAKYTFYFLIDDNILWIALLIFSTLIYIISEYKDELCEFGLLPIKCSTQPGIVIYHTWKLSSISTEQ